MNIDLTGKVALVTGAARGQGRSHAVALAQAGADVIAVDVCAPVETVSYAPATEEDLAHTAALVEKLDRRVVTHRADVRDLEGLDAAVTDGVAKLGRLDIVVANAGIFSIAPVHEMSEQQWQTLIDINLTGVWKTVRVTVPILIDQGEGGSIILVSSAAGLVGYPNTPHYVAAKHGLTGLARSMANELGGRNIRVNSVHPTTVITPMVDHEEMYRLFRPDLENPGHDDFRAAASQGVMNVLPVPWVESKDVSNAVVWLASDAARYITGTALPVDAGAAHKV